MKKLVLAVTAVAAFGGTALAADLPMRTYTKAPAVVEPTPSWTGFYVFGGGGGVWDADVNTVTNPGGAPLTVNQRMGGDGWFGTVGAGYDWQFNSSWRASSQTVSSAASADRSMTILLVLPARRSFVTHGRPVFGSDIWWPPMSIPMSTPALPSRIGRAHHSFSRPVVRRSPIYLPSIAAVGLLAAASRTT
jgi:hypothetical protein